MKIYYRGHKLDFLKKLSITNKILLLSISTLFITALANSLQFSNVIKKIENDAGIIFQGHAESFGHSVAAQFFERYGDVQAFAVNEVFRSQNQLKMIEALNTYVALYGIYDLVMFTDLNGNLIAVNSKTPQGKNLNTKSLYSQNFKGTNWFDSVLRNKFTEDKNKGFVNTYFEDVHLDKNIEMAYGEPKYSTSFSAFVKDSDGNPIGIISNRANISWFVYGVQELTSLIKSEGYNKSEITVTNKLGQVIASFSDTDEQDKGSSTILKQNLVDEKDPSIIAALEGKSGQMRSFNSLHNRDELIGFSPIKSPKFIDSIGWVVSIRIPESEAFKLPQAAAKIFYTLLLALFILCLVLVFFAAKTIGKPIEKVSQTLNKSILKVKNMGDSLQGISLDLQKSATLQNSSIEESICALTQMSKMVTQTSINIKHSLHGTELLAQDTRQGKEVMSELLSAMKDLKHSNTMLQGINSTVSEIQNKANVINDIVLKTQLLSFNASIEAARAGQHGRGFSIVATEVGNLAQLTGNAAHEIEKLIIESQKNISHTLNSIEQKVSNSERICEIAVKTFDSIYHKSDEINAEVKSITSATEQQEVGINQLNEAMKQMDSVSKTTNINSIKSNEAVTEIFQESTSLDRSRKELIVILQGEDREIH